MQAKYKSQWRPGAWLGKDAMDHDLVLVGTNEIVRCKAVRKTGEHWDGELLVGATVGPWDMRRGAHTKMETKPISTPVPELLSDVPEKPERSKKSEKANVDVDAEDVLKYAAEHPDEDRGIGEPRSSETGGAVDKQQATADTAAAAETQQQATADQQATAEASAVEGSPKRALEGSSQHERAQKGRYDHAPFKKKATEELREQAKMVRFDPETPITEPSPKALKTSSSSDVSTRTVRQVEELELYVEDEPDAECEEVEGYDWSEELENHGDTTWWSQEE